ncbi:MAG TPA: hypothetical protein VK911_04190, partial [Vicinamibacterales bacterium]|nr:hypothetical protein [Vicinamibacterales bacterium]
MRRGWNGGWLPLVLLALLVPASPRAATTITVGAGDSLQAAINAAQPGDVILLAPGATFRGNFALPNKGPGTQFITIRTGGTDPNLPAPGARVGPGHASLLATIRSSNTMTALRTEPGAHHWRLELLQFAGNQRGYGD